MLHMHYLIQLLVQPQHAAERFTCECCAFVLLLALLARYEVACVSLKSEVDVPCCANSYRICNAKSAYPKQKAGLKGVNPTPSTPSGA
jgi:hypothetical protein